MCNEEMQGLLYWLHRAEEDCKEAERVCVDKIAEQSKIVGSAYFLVINHIQHRMGYVLTDELKRKVHGLGDEAER